MLVLSYHFMLFVILTSVLSDVMFYDELFAEDYVWLLLFEEWFNVLLVL